MSSSIDEACREHLAWMNGITGNAPSTKSAQGNVEDEVDKLLAEISSTPAPKPRVSEVCAQYAGMADAAFGGPRESGAHLQYRISDVNSDNEDSDCEEYYVEDAEEIRGQTIPDWARAENLKEHLRRQKMMDPDKIFPAFDPTCDLAAMFNEEQKSFRVRGDSGMWAADSVTAAEEELYKKAIGLA